MRIRSFVPPHKALRLLLSEISMLAGKTDYMDKEQVQYLRERGRELFMLLHEHGEIENSVTLKHLQDRVPGAADENLDDHEEIDSEIKQLELQMELLTGNDSAEHGHQFYLAFSRFHGRYLEHIHEEETKTEQLLWNNFTDEELLEHRSEILSKIPFPTLLIWFRYMIPAQSEKENIGLLSALKANAPAPAFSQALSVIAEVLTPAAYQRLIIQL